MKCLPIHAAVSLKAPSIVIEELLSLHPGRALSPDDKGRAPLYLAVLHEDTFEVFEKLLSISPEAVDVPDVCGKLRYTFIWKPIIIIERSILLMILLNQ